MTGRVAIILPVLNEEGNIPELVRRIDGLFDTGKLRSLKEIVFVDGGSTDSTIHTIRKISKKEKRYRIKLAVQRVRAGTVAAALEGVRLTKEPNIVIMDADLQHPPEYIPMLLERKKRGFGIVVASRNLGYEDAERTFTRLLVSKAAQLLAHAYIKDSRKVRDPLSGFFVANRDYLLGMKPVPNFYKILIYMLAKNKDAKVSELSFRFARRMHGKSKVVSASPKFIGRYLRELSFYRKL